MFRRPPSSGPDGRTSFNPLRWLEGVLPPEGPSELTSLAAAQLAEWAQRGGCPAPKAGAGTLFAFFDGAVPDGALSDPPDWLNHLSVEIEREPAPSRGVRVAMIAQVGGGSVRRIAWSTVWDELPAHIRSKLIHEPDRHAWVLVSAAATSQPARPPHEPGER